MNEPTCNCHACTQARCPQMERSFIYSNKKPKINGVMIKSRDVLEAAENIKKSKGGEYWAFTEFTLNEE